ncbi:MAG: DegT/DnrJ/EryC1/StrS family aminotransferase [Planctomycetota bacterium]
MPTDVPTQTIANVPLLDLRRQYAGIREEIRNAIDEIADQQALVLGKVTAEFESDLADYCDCTHAIGCSSGTDALIMAMMAIDIQPGDEVILPSFTFFATAGCVHRMGAVPVFADIDPRTFNLDPADIEHRITPKTRAIVPVHLFGQCADMDAINRIACSHDLLVLEDAAQAIGATRNGRPACSMGWMGALSFYPTKNLGAFGDAGAVLCRDDALADRLRKLRVHGSGHTYYHDEVGGNFRIDALQSAVLKVKLQYLEKWHDARRANAAYYDERFAEVEQIVTPFIDAGNKSIYNQYVVRVKDRDAVKEKLGEHGVGSGIYYPLGLHLQKCFGYRGGKVGDLPHTESAQAEVLALPVYPELTEPERERVADVLIDVVD